MTHLTRDLKRIDCPRCGGNHPLVDCEASPPAARATRSRKPPCGLGTKPIVPAPLMACGLFLMLILDYERAKRCER